MNLGFHRSLQGRTNNGPNQSPLRRHLLALTLALGSAALPFAAQAADPSC
jgi:hypothetical protein